MKTKEKITAFGETAYKLNIADDGLDIPEAWIQSVIQVFDDPRTQDNVDCARDLDVTAKGHCYSTFGVPVMSFFSLPGTDKILTWVKQQIVDVAPELGFDNVKSAELTIDWMNIMTKGAFANVHTHYDEGEDGAPRKLVAILYLQAPENSSKLIVVDNRKDYSGQARGESITDIPVDQQFEISVTTGDLLIHKVAVPHGVSEHFNDTPRLCLVMEFQL